MEKLLQDDDAQVKMRAERQFELGCSTLSRNAQADAMMGETSPLHSLIFGKGFERYRLIETVTRGKWHNDV